MINFEFWKILLVTLIIIGILKIISSYIRMLKMNFPGPLPLPIIGSAYKFKLNGVDFLDQMMEMADKFAQETGVFGGFAGNHLSIVLTRAKTTEILLQSTKLITKSYFYKFMVPWLGTGLLISTGDKWQKRRKMLTPTFHYKILYDFVHVFNEQAIKMVKILKTKSQDPFDISRHITTCALDIICESAMGKKLNAQDDSDSKYVKAIYRISEIIFNRMKFPWLWPDIIFQHLPHGKEQKKLLDILHGFTISVINEKRNCMKEQNSGKIISDPEFPKRRLAFLDLLLEAEGAEQLTLEDIREEVDTFMFEGHDTTASGIQWAIQMIAQHPEIQKKLRQEIDPIFENIDKMLTMDDLSQMKYLESVIKESLRLFPPVPMFGRELTEDTKFDKYLVPKGSTAIILVQAVQRDPKYFPEPDKFKPERWSSNMEEETKMNPFAFIPFSAGMRNCIGQKFAMLEMKSILSYLIHNFNISTPTKMEDLRPCGELILRPEKGIIVQIESRQLNN